MALLDSDRVFENLEREFAEERRHRGRPPLSPVVALLATAMAGSALLHAANAPRFFDQYWAYGAFFAAVAWFQVAGAAAVLLRPSRAVFAAIGALNAVVAAVWIASRTAGVAIGPLSGTKLPVGTADAVATGLELLVVAGAVACLAAPALPKKRPTGLAPATLIAFLVVALAGGTAYAMTVSSTTGTRTVAKIVASGKSAANASSTGLSRTVGQPHNPDEAAVASVPDIPLTRDQQTLLAYQLVEARAAAMQYPTVADATKAGMIVAGGFAPGSGAHYLNYRYSLSDINADGTVNAAHPSSLIYDGTSPDSRVIGVMYTAIDTPTPPQGFAGLNDHWHRHANVCVQFGGGLGLRIPFPADRDVTQAQCSAVHGTFMKQTVWMVHAWVVPGWESPQGVFSHDNPDVKCADGTTHADKVGFCQGT
jgi:hypothetical protein